MEQKCIQAPSFVNLTVLHHLPPFARPHRASAAQRAERGGAAIMWRNQIALRNVLGEPWPTVHLDPGLHNEVSHPLRPRCKVRSGARARRPFCADPPLPVASPHAPTVFGWRGDKSMRWTMPPVHSALLPARFGARAILRRAREARCVPSSDHSERADRRSCHAGCGNERGFATRILQPHTQRRGSQVCAPEQHCSGAARMRHERVLGSRTALH